MMDDLLLNEPMTLTPLAKTEKFFFWFWWGSFILFLFFYAIRPISDPDFWWHLKTGELMVQSGGLLQADPFTFTGDGEVSPRESLILKGYWLWQITVYGLYSVFGFMGVFSLKLLSAFALAGAVIQQLHRQQLEAALVVFLMTPGFYLFSSTYSLERPQIVSFLFAVILCALLAKVRDGGQLSWQLPLLMILWANLHGGFVVGDLILLCFSAGAVFEYRNDIVRLRHVLFWVGISMAASLINPNGGMVFAEVFTFQNSELMTGVSEYQSAWVKFQQGSWSVINLWLLIVLYVVGIWKTRRFYWPEMVVAFFLACFSIAYVRNVGFFAVAMLPTIGFHLQQGRSMQARGILPVLKYFVMAIAGIVLLWQANEDWQRRRNEGSISSFYPAELTQFILTSGLQGRMYNSYNFGGYQLWKLYPQHRVFIDGRGLDTNVYNDFKLIASASLAEVEGRKEFEVLLDRYGIDYVVQPHVYFDSGRLTPLLKFLLVKPEWMPIYVDFHGYILVRNSQVNSLVIDCYQIDKRDFSNKVIGYLTATCNEQPLAVINHVALAEMLIFVGRYGAAEERLSIINRLQPDNSNLPSLRNQLSVLQNRGKPSGGQGKSQ